jgi:hypothetical protein
MRSDNSKFEPTCFLAIETTSRRLALISWSLSFENRFFQLANAGVQANNSWAETGSIRHMR